MLVSSLQILELGENIGHGKRNTDDPTKNVESNFFDDAHRSHFFCSYPTRYRINVWRSMQNMCSATPFFKPIIPR